MIALEHVIDLPASPTTTWAARWNVPALAAHDDGRRLTLDGEGELGGKLGALGPAGAERKTRETLDKFAANLNARLGGPSNAAAV